MTQVNEHENGHLNRKKSISNLITKCLLLYKEIYQITFPASLRKLISIIIESHPLSSLHQDCTAKKKQISNIVIVELVYKKSVRIEKKTCHEPVVGV